MCVELAACAFGAEMRPGVGGRVGPETSPLRRVSVQKFEGGRVLVGRAHQQPGFVVLDQRGEAAVREGNAG